MGNVTFGRQLDATSPETLASDDEYLTRDFLESISFGRRSLLQTACPVLPLSFYKRFVAAHNQIDAFSDSHMS